MTAKHTAAFVGFGQSRVYRGPDVTLGELAVEASLAAIKDAGLEVSQIDGVVCTPDAPFAGVHVNDGEMFVSTNYVTKALGLNPKWTSEVTGTLGNSTLSAVRAVEAGECDYALLFRALHNPGSGSYGHTEEVKVGEVKTSGNDMTASLDQFRSPYGVYPPADAAALPWSRYQSKYGSGTREQMATFVLQSRRHGLAFEGGYWAQYKPVELSLDDYMNARAIARPVSIFDCDIPVQGAGAFIITTAERAADLPQNAAYVHGMAEGCPSRGSITVDESWEEQLSDNTDLGRRLWADAGCAPADIDVANLYDGFSFMTMAWLEGLGFCGEGEAFEFIQDGRIAMDGALPLNPSGGNLGAGRLHGVNHLMDSVFQVTGRSGARQVADAELATVAMGVGWASGGLVLGRNPA